MLLIRAVSSDSSSVEGWNKGENMDEGMDIEISVGVVENHVGVVTKGADRYRGCARGRRSGSHDLL